MYLNGKNIIYPHEADIVWKHLEEDEGNFDRIKKKLIESRKIVQFVYSSTYPEIYSFIEKRDYFSKSENSPPPPGAVQKKLVNDEDFEKKKKLAEEQKQKELRTKARNCV